MNFKIIPTSIISILLLSGVVVATIHDNLMPAPLNDVMLTAQVKTALLLTPAVPSTEIHVTTNESRVSLEGDLANKKEVAIAKFITKTTPGVVSVNTSQLTAKHLSMPRNSQHEFS